MKNKFLLLFTCVAAMFNTRLLAQPTDIFISEYVEGSSFNKAIELYNGTNAAINLSTGQYVIEVYFNGSTSSTSLAITGSIPSGSVFIVAHPSATLSVAPTMTSTVINFNGNDAVVLKKAGNVLDVIGQVGFNPGTQWGSNDTSTLDRSLRRKILVCQGDITTSNPFFPSLEWDGFPINTFNGLGTHTTQCVAPGSGISVAPSALSFTT
jgi:predicted extracellular nuclease